MIKDPLVDISFAVDYDRKNQGITSIDMAFPKCSVQGSKCFNV